MKLKLGLFIFLSLMFLSESTNANSRFSRTTISGVVVHDFGNEILLELSSTVTNEENCTTNNMLALKKSHPSFDQMYSAILSAFHASTEIEGWVNACHEWRMPILTRLDLKK